jgi:hypothetical protein
MAEQIKESENEHWMNSKWRPAMGWMYMAVCTCDFMLFPILWSLLQATVHGTTSSQWQPLTLQGAGLFHIAMGAVLGIAAFGRTQEKLGGATSVATGVLVPQTTQPQPTIVAQPQPIIAAAAPQPEVRMINGKLAPPPAYQPEI